MAKKTKEQCEREPDGHEYAMIYNEGSTCMNCGEHRQIFAAPANVLSPTPSKIDRSFVLRLYRVFEAVFDATHELNGLYVPGAYGINARRVEIMNMLDDGVDQMERIFSEVLTDTERGVPTDEEFARTIGALRVGPASEEATNDKRS